MFVEKVRGSDQSPCALAFTGKKCLSLFAPVCPDGMRDLCTFHVSDFCELQAPADDLKFDIADFILSSVMH